MKGATRGRAGVYDRQALVLVNRGGASGREILDLAQEVQTRVSEKSCVAGAGNRHRVTCRHRPADACTGAPTGRHA